MEFHVVMVLFLTSVTLSVTSAIVPQELYWKYVLPTTPMPDVLHDLLPSDQKSKQAMDVGDGSNKNDPAIPGMLNGWIGYKSDKNDPVVSEMLNGWIGYKSNKNDPTVSGMLNGWIGYKSDKNDPTTSEMLNGWIGYKSDKNDHVVSEMLNGWIGYKSDKNDPAVSGMLNGWIGYKSDKNDPTPSKMLKGWIGYESDKNDAATSEMLNGGASQYESNKNEPTFSAKNMTLFFLGKDLRPGKDMNLYLGKSSSKTKFLPRQVAEMIPLFSSETINRYVRPNSPMSTLWKSTVESCKRSTESENEYCATSLEAMVDFIASKLGKNIQAFSTEIIDKYQKQYIINQDVRMLGTKMVVCHRQVYAYPIFFCHNQENSKAYEVPLMGKDGSEVKAIALCHGDTLKWNPNHIAFDLLKVKPGFGPICHILPADHVLFLAH
ncbi:BURP domain-containing protein [Euphorbia peplus]|nr:BURP domain-containing protein [Euphorbia peplus]